ncbi:ester cyclase [Thalassococcus sp. S3]|uniref:ester cyclase n=1 Tax=Thalassococcus sp. S3 TaxID=2017482 RepID=UPI00102440E6|nr:nuclear transport factor 2 family protein [Thalassococcus sp. S3]QBF32080.1 hypothetical protein CFI11_12735 [Thalassococcus sp. S3]
MSKIALLQAWYDDVWCAGNIDAIDRYMNAETVATGIMSEMQMGRDEFRDLVSAMRTLVEEVNVSLPQWIESGDWLAAIISVTAVRVDTQAPIVCTGQVMVRFEDDKMVETYNQFDYLSLFEQLGQFPPETLAICMTGQRLSWT